MHDDPSVGFCRMNPIWSSLTKFPSSCLEEKTFGREDVLNQNGYGTSYLLTYLLTFVFYWVHDFVQKTGRDEREQKRPSLLDGSGKGTLMLDPLSFSIIGAERDFLLETPHAYLFTYLLEYLLGS